MTDKAQHLANGLGWFSIGLGVAEIFAPHQVERLIGIRDNEQRRKAPQNLRISRDRSGYRNSSPAAAARAVGLGACGGRPA